MVQALTSKHDDPNFAFLLKPKTLYKELQQINILRRSEAGLLVPVLQYRFSKNRDGTIIIKFEMPFVGRGKYLVTKKTSIPIKIGEGLFSILVPSHDIVAPAEDGKGFAMLTEGA